MPRHTATFSTPASSSRAYLAERFGGAWDGPVLLCGFNQAQVVFDELVDRAGVAVWLEGLHVAQPGTRLGLRIIEALRNDADLTGLPLLVGPATNPGYWACADGQHPDRHPWLTRIGTQSGSPVYAYVPKTPA